MYNHDLNLIEASIEPTPKKYNDRLVTKENSGFNDYRYIKTADGGMFAVSYWNNYNKPIFNYYESQTAPDFYAFIFAVYYYIKKFSLFVIGATVIIGILVALLVKPVSIKIEEINQ